MRSAQRLNFVTAVCTLLLAGCVVESDPSPTVKISRASPEPTMSSMTATTKPSGEPSTSTLATVPPGFTLGRRTSKTFPNPEGDAGDLAYVRVGHHSGFDRVVWEFPGAGPPTYDVQYVDQPMGDSSGLPVEVRGKAFIHVLVTGMGKRPDDTPQPKDAPASAVSGTVIAQADGIHDAFEGVGEAFIGVRERKRPFRVATLENPTRLVVDISTGDVDFAMQGVRAGR